MRAATMVVRVPAPAAWAAIREGDSAVFLSERTRREPTRWPSIRNDLSALLAAFKSSDGADLVRDAVRPVLQELVEVVASQAISAARYERAGEVGQLYRPRLATRTGGHLPCQFEKINRLNAALRGIVCPLSFNTASWLPLYSTPTSELLYTPPFPSGSQF